MAGPRWEPQVSRAEPELSTALWVVWERTEGKQREERLQPKVNIGALQAGKKKKKKKRCVTFPPTLLYSVVCLLSTRHVPVTEFY